MSRAFGCFLLLILTSCAGAPPTAPDESSAWGYVRIVPREGVEAGSAAGGYGDRRLKNVAFVDYSRPGFVVVYADAGTATSGAVELALREGVSGPRFEPALAAVGLGGTIELRNETSAPQILSAREAGRIETLAPGARVRLPAGEPGENGFFLLSASRAEARVFVSPGPFAVASESGRYDLVGVGPGRHRLVAWHPRFPSTAHWVELAAGAATRVDIELGVDRPHEVGR